MKLRRRDMLATGGGLATIALFGGVQVMAAEPGQITTLLLLSESVRDTALAAQLRRDAALHRLVEQIVSVLTHDGFVTTSLLLEQATDCKLAALLNDSDALVIESLLARRVVHSRSLQRVTALGAGDIGPVLLTARL